MGKTIGGIFLIIGTSIGAGILALPVTTAESGFIASSIFLFFCWALMTFSAFLVLEVNLYLPERSNIISMTKATLGIKGEIVAWITYLVLLYALLSAYIAGGSDVFISLLLLVNVSMPAWLGTVLFTLILGFVVFLGTRAIDYTNRALMSIKLVSFFLLLIFVSHYIHFPRLLEGKPHYVFATIMIMLTSFGYATIIPSLRVYFNDDVEKLRKVIFFGSFVPLLCYILWDLVILGALPLDGNNGLVHILNSGHTTSQLMIALHVIVNSAWVTDLSRFFTSISVTTSFLGVSLSLSDFLADGFNLEKKGRGNLIIYALTFVPPIIIVTFYPTAFIMALNYAGTCCAILLALLPALMAWQARYVKHLQGPLLIKGGKPALLVTIVAASIVVMISILQELHYVVSYG